MRVVSRGATSGPTSRVFAQHGINAFGGAQRFVRLELQDGRATRLDLHGNLVLQPFAIFAERLDDLRIAFDALQRVEVHGAVVHLGVDIDARDRDHRQSVIIEFGELLCNDLAERLAETSGAFGTATILRSRRSTLVARHDNYAK